jgi:hypothetical protein
MQLSAAQQKFLSERRGRMDENGARVAFLYKIGPALKVVAPSRHRIHCWGTVRHAVKERT